MITKNKIDRHKSMITVKPQGFQSHYDKLKKRRTKSTVKSDEILKSQKHFKKNDEKRIKTNKKRSNSIKPLNHLKKKCTVPIEFSFATTTRISKHKLVQKKNTKNTQPVKSKQFTQHTNKKISINREYSNKTTQLKTLTKQRKSSFAQPTKTSNSKRSSKYIAIKQKKPTLSITINNKQSKIRQRNKSVPGLIKSKGISIAYKNAFKQFGISSALLSSTNNKLKKSQNKILSTTNKNIQNMKTLRYKQKCFSFDESSFKKMKKKLRRGIAIDKNKSRKLSNIQSAYAQSSTKKRNKSVLTPINEKNNQNLCIVNNNDTIIEDLAIDEFLTEDVYTIQNSITPITIKTINDTSPRKLSRDNSIVDINTDKIDKNISIDINSMVHKNTNNNSGMSPVQIITKKNSFIDEILFKDLLELNNKNCTSPQECNKEVTKFQRLDNLFNQIAAKIDTYKV